MTSIISLLLHAVLMLGAAPVLAEMQARVGARMQGRIGPPWLQSWRDAQRLFRKQSTSSGATSWLSAAAPLACVTVLAVAALLVPSFALGMATAPLADLVLLAGLLMTDRCALALAGYEAQTALGGVGASRVMLASAWAEPATFLVIMVTAALAGTSNLDAMGALLLDSQQGLLLPWLTAVVALAIVGRVMTADAAPTLGHNPVIPSYFGWRLAVMHYAGQLRTLVWFALLASLVPFGIAPAGSGLAAWAIGLLAWVSKVGVLRIAAALLECWAVMLGAGRAAALGLAALLAFVAAALLFASQGVA